MKTTKPLFVLSLALSLLAGGAALASGTHSHDHKPQHGGVVVEAGDVDFELVAQAELITIYVRDHGKTTTTAGAAGKLTLLNGSEKTEATLLPAGANKLEAKGRFKVASGTKAVALVTLAGRKPTNVRFVIK
jgi:hypothetical protein